MKTNKNIDIKEFKLNAYGKDHIITLHPDTYLHDGSLAVVMVLHDDGYPEPWDNLTTCLEDHPHLDGHAFVENGHYVDLIVENGIGEATDIMGYSGFNTYQLIRFNPDVFSGPSPCR